MVRTLLQPEVIIYPLLGVFITKGRIKDDYIKMVTNNLLPFLQHFWKEPELLSLVDLVREESYEDRDSDPNVPVVFKEIQNPKAIIDSIAFYINAKCKRDGRPNIGTGRKPHNQLIRLVVLYSIAMGEGAITAHAEKAMVLKARCLAGIQQFILSSVTFVKYDQLGHLLAYTSCGDLTAYIDCFINTFPYVLDNTTCYEQLTHLVKSKPEESKTREFLRIKDMADVVFVSKPIKSQLKTSKIKTRSASRGPNSKLKVRRTRKKRSTHSSRQQQ